MTRLTATDAARSFSEVLNRVADGEQIEVTRSGMAVAIISAPATRMISAERFRELMRTAPAPDAEFAKDLRTARRSVAPPTSPWPS